MTAHFSNTLPERSSEGLEFPGRFGGPLREEEEGERVACQGCRGDQKGDAFQSKRMASDSKAEGGHDLLGRG